jgi:hypothetical protein
MRCPESVDGGATRWNTRFSRLRRRSLGGTLRVGKPLPMTRVMYLHPVLRGKRQQRYELQAKNRTEARRSSRLDTAEMARLGSTEREAAWL